MQYFAFSLVNHYEVPETTYIQLVEVLLDVRMTLSAIPSSFESSANLLRVQSAPSGTSLVKLLNNIRPSIDLLYIPLITGLQLDFLTLIRTLQDQPLASFHLTSLSDYPAHA